MHQLQRHQRIKMLFLYLDFKRSLYLLLRMTVCVPSFPDKLSKPRPQEKFDRKSSSKVRKMLGCLKCKYADCIFICWHLFNSLRSVQNELGESLSCRQTGARRYILDWILYSRPEPIIGDKTDLADTNRGWKING